MFLYVSVLLFVVAIVEGGIIVEIPSDGNLQVKAGETILVQCSADESVDLEWVHNSVPVATLGQQDSRYELRMNQNYGGPVHHSLVINDAKVQDSGEIICRDSDDIFGHFGEVDVVVTPARQNTLKVTPTNKSLTVRSGTDISLNCEGSSGSRPAWTFNGQDVDENRLDVSLTSQTDTERQTVELSLTVHDANSADTGRYQCVDKTGRSASSQTIQVTVRQRGASGRR